MATHLCSVCFNETEQDPCAICSDDTRNGKVIAVVEKPSDIPLLESQGFRGYYHVLHGVISPRNGIAPDQLRIHELVARIEKGNVNELIFRLPYTTEGEATKYLIGSELSQASLIQTRLTSPNWLQPKQVELHVQVIIETTEQGKRNARLIRIPGPLKGIPSNQTLIFWFDRVLENGERRLRVWTVNTFLYWPSGFPDIKTRQKISPRYLQSYVRGLMRVDEYFREAVLSQVNESGRDLLSDKIL